MGKATQAPRTERWIQQHYHHHHCHQADHTDWHQVPRRKSAIAVCPGKAVLLAALWGCNTEGISLGKKMTTACRVRKAPRYQNKHWLQKAKVQSLQNIQINKKIHPNTQATPNELKILWDHFWILAGWGFKLRGHQFRPQIQNGAKMFA